VKRVAQFAALVLLTLTILLVLWQFRAVVGLFVLSLAVAAALRPPIEFMAERRVPRGLAMGLTYLALLAGLVGLLYLVSVPAGNELQRASNGFGNTYDRIKAQWPSGGALQQVVAARLPPIDQFYRSIGGGLAQTALGFTLSLFDLLSKMAIVLVLSIYWGVDRVHFERLWLSVLPAEQRARARGIWRSIEKGVGAYIRSEVVQSLLAGVLLGLGFWAMGLNYPALLAVIGALMWLVPLLGGALAIVPVIVAGLAQSPLLAAGAAIYAAAVFVMLEWLVEPRIFYRRRFSSILIIITMIAMSYAFGVAGLLFAPPLAAAIQILFGQLTAEPLAATSLEAIPQISSLQERLATVRALADQMENGPALETANLLERLERLMDDAGQTLSDDVPDQPLPGFARLTPVPVEK
jgi:putative permease